jgi:antitoxin component YwqK of YwqJK toxin-antitoxin module
MNFNKNILLLLITCILFPIISYSQDEISEKPKYAPHGEKHKNVTDAKGKQGAWKTYSRERVLLSEINYKNDIKHGASTKYYPSNGVLKEEANYYYGQKDGDYKSYYSNGQVNSEGSYRNGRKTGQWTSYNKSSGEKKSEGTYVDNKKDGVWTYYDIKGVKTLSGTYANDIKEGDWVSYDPDGKVTSTSKYANGVVQLKEKASSGSTNTKKSKTPATTKPATNDTNKNTDTTPATNNNNNQK